MRNNISDQVKKAFEAVKSGGVILYPTDTVWGLGCDATNCKAIARLNEIKKEMIKNLCYHWSRMYLWLKIICNQLISKDNYIGLRVVENEFCKLLLELLNNPIVSTSANIHKEPFPKSFEEINEEILKQVDYVVNLPIENWNNKPSSIIKIDNEGNLLKIR